MSATIPLLAVIALLMAAVTAYLVRFTVEARQKGQVWVALFLLAMMGEMWVAVVAYLWAPSVATLVEGLAVSGGLMVATVVPIIFALAGAKSRAGAPPDLAPSAAPRLGWSYAGLIGGIVLTSEFLMGWGLQLASGTTPASLVSGGAISVFVRVVDSPWFLFTMAAEMFLTAVWLRDRLPRPVLAIFLTQSGIMLFSPPALGQSTWTALSIYVSSALMIALFVYLFEYLYRHHQLSFGLSNYLLELVGVYGLMMAGLFVWLYFGDLTTFALSIVIEMAVFYLALSRPGDFSGTLARPWQLRSHWAFGLLSFVFVAELCMGAVLSVQLDPSDYLGGYPFLALSGSPGTVLFHALSNGFWFFAISAASTWFLIMMGLEMGTLVAFKFRETKNVENRIRLLLMMGSYSAFAVFYPSIYFALLFPSSPPLSTVPVLGWSMGVGSYPLAIGVFGVLLLTYLITGALIVLFGRRVVCSVFCTAPLMYQGTTIDSMKTFNRSSPVARKYLSSRFSGAYSLTLGLVMAALVGTSVLSYLDTTGALSVYVQGVDPSVFFFTISFSVAWYVLFVAIPYAGNYNCVTMGWCYTGAIAQAFQKIGFFKLKVRDKQVCWDCKTLDCAKGCPVGLTDMVGHFRQKGEFRSTKCCGVGDCVEDCPHDNLYISDIRHTFRRLLGRPETRPRRTGTPNSTSRSHRPTLAAAHRTTVAPLLEGATLLPMVTDRADSTNPSG